MSSEHFTPGRRTFLKRGGAAVAATIAPWTMNLAAMAEAAAATSGASAQDDYKAIVCVFLQGGNDHANTLVPFDQASHDAYLAARPSVAIARAALNGLELDPVQALPSGRQMALAPALMDLKPLFDDGRMAVLLNIGPLQGPTSRADYYQNRSLPPKLFSHNDQQAVWQSSQPEGALTGWGGVIGEQGLPAVASRQARDNLACVNLSGNAVFLAGNTASQYMVDPLGVQPLRLMQQSYFGASGLSSAFRAVSVNLGNDAHWLARRHAGVLRSALDTNSLLRAEVDAAGARIQPLTGAGESLRLRLQLNMVARIIEARQRLGLRRQVFFVSLGGFDHHDNLSANHPELLQRVGEALAAFQADLSTLGVEDQVTTFTASDFGRTMNSNGDGSDHGWGSYHFVLGGAVRGQRFYGTLPDVVGGETDIGQGRLLPTTAVDHLSATLARWMGVTDASALSRIAPYLSRWNGQNPLSGLLAGV